MKNDRLIEKIKRQMDIEIICRPDDEDPADSFASGDDEADAETVAQIREEMEWNEWAWCTVEVKGEWNGIEMSEFLGGCSYKDKKDFIANSGYYDDMVENVAELIAHHAQDIVKAVRGDKA